jgi:hypothetical protein
LQRKNVGAKGDEFIVPKMEMVHVLLWKLFGVSVVYKFNETGYLPGHGIFGHQEGVRSGGIVIVGFIDRRQYLLILLIAL